MALTLNATLATAQDQVADRKPLVEIMSGNRVPDIPFDGQYLANSSYDEYSPTSFAHSTGRIVSAYAYGPAGSPGYGIKYVYTDVDRTEFFSVDIPTTANPITGVSACELTDGKVGIVYIENDASAHLYRLRRRIVTVVGVAVSNAEIANWSHDTETSTPWVATVDTDSYLLVYSKKAGSDYYFQTRASADFITWGSETQISVAGLTSTWQLSNPSLLKISTGDLWLWFDALEDSGPSGERLTNIYYSVSTDNGGTWSSATKATNYDNLAEVGEHPVAVQKAAGSMSLLYTRVVSVLKMNKNTTGWCHYGDGSLGLQWDATNRKIYMICGHAGAGSKCLYGVVKIDVDTWTVDKYWDDTTTPGFPAWVGHSGTGYHIWYDRHEGDAHMVAILVSPMGTPPQTIFLLDGEADSIREYDMVDFPAQGITTNCICPAWTQGKLNDSAVYSYQAQQVRVDLASNRLYVQAQGGYLGCGFAVGYFDITDPGPTYSMTTLIDVTYGGYEFIAYDPSGVRFWPTEGLITVASQFMAWDGFLRVYLIADGSEYKHYTYAGFPDFPKYGVYKDLHCENGKIYCGFRYVSTYGQANNRGLCIIDMATDLFTFVRPTYASIDNYGLCFEAGIIRGEPNELIMCAMQLDSPDNLSYSGIVIYNEITGAWTLYRDINVPGLGDGQYWMLRYDSTNKMIMAAQPSGWGGQGYFVMFSVYGYMKQTYLSEGTLSGGTWSFGTAEAAVQGYKDFDMVAAVDPGSASSMFVFWNNEIAGTGENSVKWDKDASSFDLSPYIVGEVVTNHSIDGNPHSLEFSVSHGHLFDPYNAASTLTIYLKKGRALTLRWGEKITGTDYWQIGGVFFVTEISDLSYERGVYTSMRVKAEDERAIWQDHQVLATVPYAAQYAEDIMTDALIDICGYEAGDISFPVFVGRTPLTYQWIDTTIGEMCDRLCHRFGYAFGFTYDGKATARRITTLGAIAHSYTDRNALITYAPDNRFSDFTNRVTVKGYELDYTEVMLAEERVGSIHGTVGWYGYKNDFMIWFSDDKSRRCREPRLEVIETATSIAFKLAGDIEEELIDGAITYDEKGCIVRVSCPDLRALLYGLIVADIAMAIWMPDWVYVPPVTGGWLPTWNIGRSVLMAGVMAAMMVLASTGNFQYAVWAKPVGEVRRSVQSAPPAGDDTALITELGMVVEKIFEDELCFSRQDCNTVAAFEIMVAKAQRDRITIKKIGHLQDEIADTIRFIHPYSTRYIDVFITDLKRKYKKSEPGQDDGYFIDEITGWKVNAE